MDFATWHITIALDEEGLTEADEDAIEEDLPPSLDILHAIEELFESRFTLKVENGALFDVALGRGKQ